MESDEGNISTLLKAIRFAAEKHRNQRRKDQEASPYINHPIAVAEILFQQGGVMDIVTLVGGILHDTIEDTETTLEELETHFGGEVRAVVQEVSDDKNLPKEERKRLQIENAKDASERARLIKLVDKICNLQDIIASPPANWAVDRKRKYVEWARSVIEQIRGTNSDLERHFDGLCQEALLRLAER